MALIKDGKVYRTFEEQLIYLTEDNKDINKTVSDAVEAVADKQDKLTAGNNITITGSIISATQPDISTKQDKLTAGNNITITGSIISATQPDISTKQDKLTAGDNITIENNVISASGGGGGCGEVWEDITIGFVSMNSGQDYYYIINDGWEPLNDTPLRFTIEASTLSPSLGTNVIGGTIQLYVNMGSSDEITLLINSIYNKDDKSFTGIFYMIGVNIYYKYGVIMPEGVDLPKILKVERLIGVN